MASSIDCSQESQDIGQGSRGMIIKEEKDVSSSGSFSASSMSAFTRYQPLTNLQRGNVVQSKDEEVMINRSIFQLAAQGEIFPDDSNDDLKNIRDEMTGMSLLHVAAAHGQMGSVRVLISKYNCDVNCQDDEGKAPLHMASYLGHLHVMRELLICPDIDIDITDDHKNTPLIYAVFGQQLGAVKELVKHGADVSIENSDHETAYSICYKKEFNDIKSILDQHLFHLLNSLVDD